MVKHGGKAFESSKVLATLLYKSALYNYSMFKFNEMIGRKKETVNSEKNNLEINSENNESLKERSNTLENLYSALKSKTKDAALIGSLFLALSANAQDKSFNSKEPRENPELKKTINIMPMVNADIVDFKNTVTFSLQDSTSVSNQNYKTVRFFAKQIITPSQDTLSLYDETTIDEENNDTLTYSFTVDKNGAISYVEANIKDGKSTSKHEKEDKLAKMIKKTFEYESTEKKLNDILIDMRINPESTHNLHLEAVTSQFRAYELAKQPDINTNPAKGKEFLEHKDRHEKDLKKIDEIEKLVRTKYDVDL